MNKRNLILTFVFLLIVIVELLGRLIDVINLEYAVKPLILVWIAVYYILNAKKRPLRPEILIAFFFSWVGDILLMLSGGYNNEMLFYAGVGGFFLAQLAYIYVFLKNKENSIKGFLLRRPYWAIPLLAYLIGIYMFLEPGLEGIMKPIILAYAISLIGMSLAAVNRKDRVGGLSYKFVLIGSLFFVLSDSMIAVNKFHTAIPYEGFLIMATYILAQYLILRGLVEER